MPLFYFECQNVECDRSGRQFFKILAPGKTSSVTCEACQQLAKRTPKAPSSMSVEVVDDGYMPKRIERTPEAKRVFKERAIEHERRREEESSVLKVSDEIKETIEEELLDKHASKS